MISTSQESHLTIRFSHLVLMSSIYIGLFYGTYNSKDQNQVISFTSYKSRFCHLSYIKKIFCKYLKMATNRGKKTPPISSCYTLPLSFRVTYILEYFRYYLEV